MVGLELLQVFQDHQLVMAAVVLAEMVHPELHLMAVPLVITQLLLQVRQESERQILVGAVQDLRLVQEAQVDRV
jgi:hypothetical protein